LEKTIFGLGSALTVARQKEKKTIPIPTAGENFKDKYDAVTEELETMKVQFHMETQQREALQEELNDISKERAEEASSAQARLRLHDRKVSNLESTIVRLQTSLREPKEGGKVFTTDNDGNARYCKPPNGKFPSCPSNFCGTRDWPKRPSGKYWP
jgi:chromosome segregation ATPase